MSAPSPAHNPSPTLSRHALFGGGLSAELPSNLIDARCVIRAVGYERRRGLGSKRESPYHTDRTGADIHLGWDGRSDLRQIPDTQEVWLSPDSDVTFIVEILEAVPGSDGQSSLECVSASSFAPRLRPR